jgi:4-hydroxy-tetrahydrodipicolinate reductase
MKKLRLAINGAAGRMGQRLVALGHADDGLEVAAALEYSGCPKLGVDAGLVAGIGDIGVPLTHDLDAEVDVVIDFSLPSSAVSVTELCVSRNIPLVMATTGLSEDQQAVLAAAAHKIPLVWAPSMSVAVNLTMKLATVAAATLKDSPTGADVEVIERHHRFKEDAPSGTALRFGEFIAKEMGQTEHQHGRQGMTGQRPRNEIGYHALRVGDNPGEHTIVFGLIGETIELTVRATNRDSYALGALQAARFVTQNGPGHYTMFDVLGL